MNAVSPNTRQAFGSRILNHPVVATVVRVECHALAIIPPIDEHVVGGRSEFDAVGSVQRDGSRQDHLLAGAKGLVEEVKKLALGAFLVDGSSRTTGYTADSGKEAEDGGEGQDIGMDDVDDC